MLCRAAPIRTAARLCTTPSIRLAPKCSAPSFSTTAKQSSSNPAQRCSLLLKDSKSVRPSPQIRLVPHRSHLLSRLSSTAAPGAGAATSGLAESESQLTWNRFLALRRQRRRISLIASMVCAVVCVAGGVVIIGSQDIESFGAQIYGFDTIFVLGLSTLAFGVVGWLIGPFIGNAVFNTWHRKLRQQIAAKEKEFYARIKRYRVDPSASSIANPVPDYYGEKIGSVKDYRRWLKDQRAFNLKRGRMV